ncbi:MGMT family protein [Streptomyces sp. NPDC001848]|uniref:MGMT family protein n=1 Tax=Streptomyces sp. NPDC001848 TaxID=3364618 RepID=UPI00369E7EE7
MHSSGIEIASAQRWGKAEILQRADRLAERAVELWPGPIGGVKPAGEESPGWAELRAALVAMPSGTWTTYGDVAELIGSHPVAVGAYLSANPTVIGAYRVLTSEGRISPSFRWADGSDRQPPQDLLTSEGVRFDSWGRAHHSQRLTAAELATLLGKDVAQPVSHDPLPEGEDSAAAERFRAQLRNHWPDAYSGVMAALDFWRRQGGYVNYGRYEETSCFPTLDAGTSRSPHLLWPVGMYPVTGTVEVVFQYLKSRSPFDDTEQRRELLNRLNSPHPISRPPACRAPPTVWSPCATGPGAAPTTCGRTAGSPKCPC